MARPPLNRLRSSLLQLQADANVILESGDRTSFRFRFILRLMRELGEVLQALTDGKGMTFSKSSARYLSRVDELRREIQEAVDEYEDSSSEALVVSSEDDSSSSSSEE